MYVCIAASGLRSVNLESPGYPCEGISIGIHGPLTARPGHPLISIMSESWHVGGTLPAIDNSEYIIYYYYFVCGLEGGWSFIALINIALGPHGSHEMHAYARPKFIYLKRGKIS